MTQEPSDPLACPHADLVFGAAAARAERYADLLQTDGITRGVLGPAEGPRIWDRHVLNSVAPAAMITPGATVVDLGSGAGLPGIPLALARPDLRVVLLEPLARRVSFLTDTLAALGLDQVQVWHCRAQDAPVRQADVVVARAVAPLVRLVPMSLRLLSADGVVLAHKGDRAEAEIEQAQSLRLGVRFDVLHLPVADAEVRVVRVQQSMAARS